MKKYKKIIGTLCITGVVISMLSSIAIADVGYNFTLPAMGSKYTQYENKPDKGTTGHNYASYVGWSDTIHCWIDNDSRSQLTTTASYDSAGTVTMYYSGSLGNDYYGHPVQMGIKTGPTVWHEIDVRGDFSAD